MLIKHEMRVFLNAGNFRPGAQTVPETTDKNFCETMFLTQHSCPMGNLKSYTKHIEICCSIVKNQQV